MKSLFVVLVLFFSVQIWAIPDGYYECESNYGGDGENDKILFGFEFYSDRLVMLANGFMNQPEETYHVSRNINNYYAMDLDANNKQRVLEFLHYKLYTEADVLKLETIIKPKGIDFLSTSIVTFTPTSRDKVTMLSVFSNEIMEEIIEASCVKQSY